MTALPFSPAVLIASGIAILAILLYIREYFLRRKASGEQQKISNETRQKSLQLLHAAEIAESAVITDGKFATDRLELELKTQLEAVMKSSQGAISTSQEQLIAFMEDLKKRSGDFEDAFVKTQEQRVNELFEKLETKLSDFLIGTEQKTTSSIDLELKATRQLIETYKAAQLKLIDENIIAMMEQTLNIVLGKKLSLKDQLELVYDALERAKVEKFVI